MNRPNKRASGLSVYSNLAHKRRTKRDAEARRRAEFLATLPKHPVQRVLYLLEPRRFFGYWFSKRGGIMALKITGVVILLMFLLVGGLFAYYRKDLDQIRPGELAKRVQSSVTRYYDRNGQLLWEDKGQGNYKLVVDGNEINNNVKQATVAIEDKDFYHHGGVSITGILRSLFNNLHGGDTQGGSTLTQQLVKQVFFADQAGDRGISGIPRKIKEMILAIEVERMYSKDQILNLYLNESPYGGRRNGVESGAQTYFGRPAKDLTLPQAAVLASIPNSPGLYDPYNLAGHDALIARQHDVLDHMADQGYITKQQAEDAKKVPVLDQLQPPSSQYSDIKAPHFVQYVRSQLEQSLGKATVGQGGLSVTTTLDLRIQQKLEQSMSDMFKSSTPAYAGFTNGAATVEDTQTGQIVAMMGSRSYDYPGFGQDNAALAYIQPGSTIKPLVYSQLFSNQGANKQNYGSGSILSDSNDMQKIYGAPLYDADHKFMGDITIRKSLALSRNVPAVKAMYIAGIDPTMATIKAMGDSNYCTQGIEVQSGLSSAIGGCGTRMIDHVNAFASIARMGTYKPVSTVLKVTNSQGETIQEYKDESKKIVDPQATYIVSDILADDNARAGLYGPHFPGLYIPGVKMAVKTGTSDKDGKPKDIWNVGYTPALTMAVWLGNSDTTPLTNGNSSLPAKILGPVMEYAHKEIYAKEGKWSPANGGSWFTEPAGIQHIGNELYPSWYSKNPGQNGTKQTFDKVSKFKATSCTPDAAKIDLTVSKMTAPINNRTVYTAPDGYDASQDDNVHHCGDPQPTISISSVSGSCGGNYTITATVTPASSPVQSVNISVGGTNLAVSGSGTTYTATYSPTSSGPQTVTATVTDNLYYTGTDSETQSFGKQNGG